VHTLIASARRGARPCEQVGIDDALVIQTREQIFELNNGCVCCTGDWRVSPPLAAPVCLHCAPPPSPPSNHATTNLRAAHHTTPQRTIAVRGDLIRTVSKLLKRRQRFDAIVIETTGLANPAPVIQVCVGVCVLGGGGRRGRAGAGGTASAVKWQMPGVMWGSGWC
jgi:hypothetical protein